MGGNFLTSPTFDCTPGYALVFKNGQDTSCIYETTQIAFIMTEWLDTYYELIIKKKVRSQNWENVWNQTFFMVGRNRQTITGQVSQWFVAYTLSTDWHQFGVIRRSHQDPHQWWDWYIVHRKLLWCIVSIAALIAAPIGEGKPNYWSLSNHVNIFTYKMNGCIAIWPMFAVEYFPRLQGSGSNFPCKVWGSTSMKLIPHIIHLFS